MFDDLNPTEQKMLQFATYTNICDRLIAALNAAGCVVLIGLIMVAALALFKGNSLSDYWPLAALVIGVFANVMLIVFGVRIIVNGIFVSEVQKLRSNTDK